MSAGAGGGPAAAERYHIIMPKPSQYEEPERRQSLEQRKAQYARHDRARLCRLCFEKRVRGKRFCDRHLAEQSMSMAALRADRKAKHLCIECGDPAVTRTYCETHRLAHVQRNRELRAAKASAN